MKLPKLLLWLVPPVVAVVTLGVLFVERLLSQGDNGEWGTAIQLVTTLVLAAATVAYVLLTYRLMQYQAAQTQELRSARRHENASNVISHLRVQLEPELTKIESNASDWLSRDVPSPDFIPGVKTHCEELLGHVDTCMGNSPKVPLVHRPDYMYMCRKVHIAGRHLLILVHSVESAYQAHQESGSSEEPTVSWDQVKSQFYTAVRQGHETDPEWSDLVSMAAMRDAADFAYNLTLEMEKSITLDEHSVRTS